jgi:hypothetical protein
LIGQAVRQRRRAEEGFFHAGLPRAVEGDCQARREERVDVRGERDLGLTEAETAVVRSHLVTARQEARDGPVRRICERFEYVPVRITDTEGL